MNYSKIKNIILSLFYPSRCCVCGKVINIGGEICNTCMDKIIPIPLPVCHRCGESSQAHDASMCEALKGEIVGAYYYESSVREMIINLKNTGKIQAVHILLERFYDVIAKEYSSVRIDVVLPVPAYEKGKTTSSQALARETAERLQVDYYDNLLIKTRDTPKQHLLNQKERLLNLEDAFSVYEGLSDKIKGKTVLLIDDVKTTGTTLNRCVEALMGGGASEVYCACLSISKYYSG